MKETKKINYQFWVTLKDPNYTGQTMKISKNKPSLSLSEVAFQMNVSVPESYFKKPELKASIEFPERETKELDIPIDLNRISEVIQMETGHRVEVQLVNEIQE